MAHGNCKNGDADQMFRRLLTVETDDHIPWPYGKNAYGYGQIRWKGGPRLAHQLALELRVGPKPSGMGALHNLGCPKHCMNYRHLRWGTQGDNVDDMRIEGTMSMRHAAKLTEDQVREIRRRFRNGEQGLPLAAEFGVHRNQIYLIASGKAWGWLA